MSAKLTKTAAIKSAPQAALDFHKHADNFLWTRETIESIVVAFLLAFLFRTFEAEPFSIPTGSMAPTLLGSHKDIYSVKTGFRAQYNASMETPEQSLRDSPPAYVLGVVDPMSRFPQAIDPYQFPNDGAFCGDRILVSKFIYDFTEPQRWDVIVFKYPGDAKINYIKRLIGLPNESIRVGGGDIWAKPIEAPDTSFRIQRKPDVRLLAMLQLVDDTNYIAPDLQKVAWPSKWQTWSAGEPIKPSRSSSEDKEGLKLTSTSASPAWLRYYQVLPGPQDWFEILNGDKPAGMENRGAEPITDFVAYNATYDTQSNFGGSSMTPQEYRAYCSQPRPSRMHLDDQGRPVELDAEKQGLHWVGDLAIEVDAKVESDTGLFYLDLVRGGEHFQCKIDIATGIASLSRSQGEFANDSGGDGNEKDAKAAKEPTARTSLKGKGSYKLRFSNIDRELRLWVGGSRVAFNGPTTYTQGAGNQKPHFSGPDPLDLAPIGIGVEKAAATVTRARVLRDIYYQASNNRQQEYGGRVQNEQVREILLDPSQWATTDLFDNMLPLEFDFEEDEFMPMGDNSAQSQDARWWHHVDRHLLVGKALAVYWTHPWNRPPYWPEFGRIRFIR